MTWKKSWCTLQGKKTLVKKHRLNLYCPMYNVSIVENHMCNQFFSNCRLNAQKSKWRYYVMIAVLITASSLRCVHNKLIDSISTVIGACIFAVIFDFVFQYCLICWTRTFAANRKVTVSIPTKKKKPIIFRSEICSCAQIIYACYLLIYWLTNIRNQKNANWKPFVQWFMEKRSNANFIYTNVIWICSYDELFTHF